MRILERFSFAPSGLVLLVALYPALARWAAFLRSFGAAVGLTSAFTPSGGLRCGRSASGFPAFERREGWGRLWVSVEAMRVRVGSWPERTFRLCSGHAAGVST